MAGLSDLPLKEIPYGQKEVFLITFRVKFGGGFLILIPLQCNQPVPKQCYAALLQLPRSLGCQPCYISDSFWRQRKLLLFSSKFSLKNEKPLVTAWVLSLEHRFSAAQTGCLGALSSPLALGLCCVCSENRLSAPNWGHKTIMQKKPNLGSSCSFSSGSDHQQC